MAEIYAERIDLALEATRGTAVTPPTHNLDMLGTLTPVIEYFSPVSGTGTLAEGGDETPVRKYGLLEANGALDAKKAPLIANMVLQPVTSPTTPTNGVATRLWAFVRVMTANTIKSATTYWGDVNQKLYQGAYTMIDEWSWSSDATGTEGAVNSISGQSQFPDDLASNPTLPTVSPAKNLIPGTMQMWMDTSSVIGTTAITGRVLSADGTIPTGVTYKYPATGPAGSLSYTLTGRVKTRPTMTIMLELPDQTQYDLFQNGTAVKLRLRISGDLIESVTPDYYYYFEQDIYGKLRDLAWGEHEGSNRTVSFTIHGVKDATLGSDCRVAIQNINTTL